MQLPEHGTVGNPPFETVPGKVIESIFKWIVIIYFSINWYASR